MDDDLWVFGYGSLMWRPGFPHEEAAPARLFGRHRALCVYSVVHRGTEERPGLVLGLDRGGSCRGIAFRVAPHNSESVIAYLRQRELVTSVYLESRLPIRLENRDFTTVAMAFEVDRKHPQYAGPLPRQRALELVRDSVGEAGHNRDYVINTADHLKQLGIHDPELAWLAERLREQDAP
ncbi:MAG: gamma-glutamylcyclotransferase [Bauldia sp.]|nr:gamma-glutamylcyclotransferase [Bauldia sp.]